ncbi:unnamed protein product [Ectocarpus sp. 4 AP-2014]
MPDLGFNCRTERDKWRAGGIVHTAPLQVDVGPGSYDIAAGGPPTEGRPGYAPFLSTAERKLGPDTAAADLPGPGYYSSEPVQHNSGLSGRPSDVFRSGTTRFRPSNGGQGANDTPGPGTYLGHGEFGTREQGMSGNFKGNSDKIKWVRVPTAPSIPGREQSYGYEEGDQGELVMQRPVELGHSGRGDDRPGPVDYQPRVEYTRRCPAAIDFSKGEDRLVALSKARASTTPGPGHYNAARGLGDPDDGLDIGRAIHRKRQRPTASFHYGTKRDRQRKARDTAAPGPGDYKIPSGLDVRRDPGRRDLSFLSTSRRFDEPATGAGSRAPGPGSYVTAPSDFDRCREKDNRVRPRRASFTAPVGFQSTTLRFAGDGGRGGSEIGPASYSLGGMAEEISRKGSGTGRNGGAFGSTAKRFPVAGGGQPHLPGPGAYELGVAGGVDPEEGRKTRHSVPVGPSGKRFPSALSAFASATKRFAPPSSANPGPAPGQYEVRPLDKPRGVLPLGKQSKNRFESAKNAVRPGLGPGSYDVRDVVQLGRARSRKNIMVSSQARFTDPSAPSSNNPGPGYYGTGMVYGNLLKQTYNIAIAEASADIC